jgi:dipeptidyl aminopeptidase/acylaminoacyl peptidase
VNITSSPGYDNQPSFAPDGKAIFFTSARGAPSEAGTPPRLNLTDIYRYDLSTKAIVRVTATPEGEYSPTVTPDGGHISVVRVEADSTQRLWRFTIDGRQPEIVLPDVKPVGYHAWADARTVVLFVLGKPSTLHVADTATGKSIEVAKDVGRSIQRMPGGRVSFVQRQPAADGKVAFAIMELDPHSRTVTHLIPAVAGATDADMAWTPDGTLLMAHADALYSWKRGQTEWTRAVDLGQLGLKGVTRLAVSPKGDRLALVAR